ncbi:MAG TPA: hypothetical protein DCE78_01750 [Bacteroidetes bacterium]|nr:hypothetical protein [Bacteroidota bacterium]
MGTGHSVDSPIRVAHLGISSVISIVDDLLLERIRKHYSNEFNLPFNSIARNAPDGRAVRITAYLDMVHEIVNKKFEQVKQASFHTNSEKDRYFGMLASDSPLRTLWENLPQFLNSNDYNAASQRLNEALVPGSIDVNIMSKVDHLGWDSTDMPLSSEFSDACAALRGFANSVIESAVVLSAGFNPRLYGYMSNFPGFYRDATGNMKKKIVLKVSDFRSALIQGKFLAKSGLEVSEYRIESGLNCGGHAFYSDGKLLPSILDEFKAKKSDLTAQLKPMIKAFYDKMGWEYPESVMTEVPRITVQGGIGIHGEQQRLLKEFEVDGTGWGSPFLVVPEATCVDDATMQLLINATVDDFYLSKVSPLGIPFNNVRRTGSEKWTADRVGTDKPGSPCPKGFLKSNTEFTDKPICTASTEYQILKIAQINESDLPHSVKSQKLDDVHAKVCLCDHLGNGSLIKLGIIKEKQGPQAICPGPNLAWFKGPYTLEQMTDHIYGRGESLVPQHRPHMFAKELEMNIDYYERLVAMSDPDDPKSQKYLATVRENLEEGIRRIQELANTAPFSGENLESLKHVKLQSLQVEFA